MAVYTLAVLLGLLALGGSANGQESGLPVKYGATTLLGDGEVCPTTDQLDAARTDITEDLRSLITTSVLPHANASRYSPSAASYLDYPRINFFGKFRGDVSTINNNRTNYNFTTADLRFNPVGTGDFYFLETFVTSVVYENGTVSEEDAIVDASLLNNIDSTSAKLVDLDVDAQLKSTVYGMNLVIAWKNSSGDNPVRAVEGDWVRSVMVHDAWRSLICGEGGDTVLAANTVTRIENVVWNDLGESLALQQLRQASELLGGKLSVRIAHYLYTASDEKGNFTIGNVVGTIGVAKPGEPLNFGAERIMSFQNVPFANFTLDPDDSCYDSVQNGTQYYWANKAPFQIKERGDKYILSVDLANALSRESFGMLRNLGQLYFAVLVPSVSCAELIGEKIDYLEEDWITRTGGIVDLELVSDQFERLQTSKLLLVRLDDNSTNNASYKVCESLRQSHYVQLLLEERNIFVRPMDYYVYRLQKNYNESATVDFYVTEFGKPAGNMTVRLTQICSSGLEPIPMSGVSPNGYEAQSNEGGIATFNFSITETIPFPRRTTDGQVVDVDGQVYSFLYNANVMDTCTSESVTRQNSPQFAFCSNALTILAFTDASELGYTEPYNWVDHIQPIFEQYYRLYPVMASILNMSNYTDVTLPYNVDLLRLALSQDFMAPGYMPVTRDLSPYKQNVILEWLNSNTSYNSSSSAGPAVTAAICLNQTEFTEDEFLAIELCGAQNSYSEEPGYPNSYYEDIAQLDPEQPYAQWQLDEENGNCTLDSLRGQVQLAVELEFATIPLYLTSLYTIRDGCNTEVYEIIRGVLMQEMLHMAQSANILIALGRNPIIDSNETAPSYPRVGLPGNVLPQLNVSLKRATRAHIRNVFMGVEYPHDTGVATGNESVITNSTIGQFYQHMNNCMVYLTEQGEDIFMNDTAQLYWPWDNPYGTLHQITDLSSAINGINEIIEQGEGNSPIDPEDSQPDGQLAHFYQFEQIVCGRYLVDVNGTYSYGGDAINFKQEGVWPMRDNPGKNGIMNGTRGYVEARAFHDVYRALLRKLQQVFDGQPELLQGSVTLMESLQVHAKKLMKIPLGPNTTETVGLVFDYIWDD